MNNMTLEEIQKMCFDSSIFVKCGLEPERAVEAAIKAAGYSFKRDLLSSEDNGYHVWCYDIIKD